MPMIQVDEALWSTNLMPEGIVEQWFVGDGDKVLRGQRVAEVRVEGALHEIMAAADGRVKIFTPANCVIEPGSRIGALE